MTLRRAVLLSVVAVDALLLVALWPQLRSPPRRLEDRVGLIPAPEERHYNQYLEWVRQESGIDIHIVLAPDTRGLAPERSALATMRELGVGQETGGRGLLVLYDTTGRTMRLEAGPRLEGILPDAFLGYLMREHLDPMFGAGRPEIGLRTTLYMIHWRIRRARLGEEYDPSFQEYIRDLRRVAVGGGASGRVAGEGTAHLVGLERDSGWQATFRPQPTVEAAHNRLQEWLALGCRDVDVPLFTPNSRKYLHALPLSPALCAYLLAAEFGRRYQVDERGDLALLFFTDDPFASPHFFRRTPEGWLVDFVAEVANTQDAVGFWYTWRLRVSGDDFSRVFADRYTPMLMPGTGVDDFYRVAGGDNRALVIRGNAETVESELAPNAVPRAESYTDGVPGVEYLTVRQAAERIQAAKGRPAVVLLYGTWNEQTQGDLPAIVRTARTCRDRGIAFLAFHTDNLPRAVDTLPRLLRQHDAPFPAVQLYRWRSGMLDATMAPLGIQVGRSWSPPLVAVLDGQGAVVWQSQGVTDWAAVEEIAAGVAAGAGREAR
jgi:uncharacterized protein